MNKKLNEEIESFGEWLHLIELSRGVFTVKREHWHAKRHVFVKQDYMTKAVTGIIRMLYSEKIHEMSILDLGCNDGWLSLVLHRMGFKSIVGVDQSQAHINRAGYLKRHFKMDNVEFVCSDIMSFVPKEKYDLVIFMGVINHMNRPVELFKKIYNFTNKSLLLDFDSLSEIRSQDDNIRKLDVEVNQYPGDMKCHFQEDHNRDDKGYELVFQYSKRAIKNIMYYAGFDNIMSVEQSPEVPPEYSNDNRAFLVGHKSPNPAIYKQYLETFSKYKETRTGFLYPWFTMHEDGYNKYNILVELSGEYLIAVPQSEGELKGFDYIENEKVFAGQSLNEIKKYIDQFIDGTPRCPDYENIQREYKTKLGINISKQYMYVSEYSKAKRILRYVMDIACDDESVLNAEKILERVEMLSISGEHGEGVNVPGQSNISLLCNRVFL